MTDIITGAEELARLGEAYFTTQHSYDPYNATLLGVDEFDGLSFDPSREASERTAQELAAIGHQVRGIDTGGLTDAERIDHGVLTALVEGARSDAEHSLWAANASAKSYVSRQGLIFQTVPAMTIASPEAAARYLSRLSRIGATLDALGQRYLAEAADGRTPTAVGRLGQVPPAERIEGRADLRQPAEVAGGGLRGVDGHGGHRLEDEALPADVALGRRVGGPERVLGVGPGALGQGGEHQAIDALGVGETDRVDLAHAAADGREFPCRGLARLPARVEGQPVELGDAEERRVVRVVAVLGGEVRLAEPGELGRGRRESVGQVLS